MCHVQTWLKRSLTSISLAKKISLKAPMFFCEKDIGKKDDFLGKCELSSSKVLAGWAKFFPFGEADAIDLKNIQSGDVTVTTG